MKAAWTSSLGFNTALTACRAAWPRVLALLAQMRQGLAVRPDLVSFNAALAAVAVSGEKQDWEAALVLLEALREEHLLPVQGLERAVEVTWRISSLSTRPWTPALIRSDGKKPFAWWRT